MTSLAAIGDLAADRALAVAGAFHLGTDEAPPLPSQGTLILLAPREPGFWAHLTASPEWQDGGPDPIDRWSRRVIGDLAALLGGQALFPFDGPPHAPFYSWALRSGRAWASPVRFLVHDRMGLFASYRGALALPESYALLPPVASPCETCAAKPCLTACPVGALGAEGYDTAACHAYLGRPEGAECMNGGCQVRRACPVSHAYGRLARQNAYHMGRFHR